MARTKTPGDKLISASKSGNLAGIKEALAAGADINYQDEDGRTALMWASCEERTELVKFLVSAGADVNLRDYYGNTALVDAIKTENMTLVKFLESSGAKV